MNHNYYRYPIEYLGNNLEFQYLLVVDYLSVLVVLLSQVEDYHTEKRQL